MIGYFLVALGSILLFAAAVEGLAQIIDRLEDWKDWDRERREARRLKVRSQYWDREALRICAAMELPPEIVLGPGDPTVGWSVKV